MNTNIEIMVDVETLKQLMAATKKNKTTSKYKRDGKRKATRADALPKEYKTAFMNALLEGRYGFRNYAVYLLQYATGRRVSDIAKLKVEDVVDLEEMIVYDDIEMYEEKTKKPARVRVPDIVKEAILIFIEEMLERGVEVLPENLLFRSQVQNKVDAVNHDKIGGINERTISGVYKEAAKKCGIPSYIHISSHTPRKTLAVDYRERFGELEGISEYYNHANVGITRRYGGMREEEIKAKVCEVVDTMFGQNMV